MPILPGSASPNNPYSITTFQRKLFVTDKDGVEHQITNQAELQAIIDQMTPEQFKDWEARYRFAPIQNLTGNKNYTGTGIDI